MEIVRAGKGAEQVRALQGVAAPVHGERPGHFAEGAEAGVHVIQRIGGPGRAGRGADRITHPGRIGIARADGGRRSHGRGGRDVEVLGVLEKV